MHKRTATKIVACLLAVLHVLFLVVCLMTGAGLLTMIVDLPIVALGEVLPFGLHRALSDESVWIGGTLMYAGIGALIGRFIDAVRQSQRKTKWLYVRLLFAALLAASTPTFAANVYEDTPAWLPLLYFVAVFGPALGLLHLGVCLLPTRDWSRPTWFTNPFAGLPHFLHLGSVAFLGAGIAMAIRSIYHHRTFVGPLLMLAVALGLDGALRVFYRFRGDLTPSA